MGRYLTARSARVGSVAIIVIAIAATGFAQRFRLPEGPNVPARYRPQNFNDGAFSHCKLMYRSVRSEANGMGWGTDYPYAGINLMTRVREITKRRSVSTPTASRTTGWCGRWTMRSSGARSRWPLMSAPRSSLPKRRCGCVNICSKADFLWVDDFWGTRGVGAVGYEMQQGAARIPHRGRTRRSPDSSHACSSSTQMPQVTSINFWRRSGGVTSERGPDSPHADFQHDRGRAWPDHGADDAQHRHRRFVGARRRRSASSSCTSRPTATRSASTSCCTRSLTDTQGRFAEGAARRRLNV